MFNRDFVLNKLHEFEKANPIVKNIGGMNLSKTDIASRIDHTLLKPDASKSDILKLCSEARTHGFYSVCVNPCNIETVTKELFGSTVKICTVVGFPLGANETSVKIDETELAINSGANEIDMVLNIGRLKDRELEYIITEISSISEYCHKNNALLKVIIETALLTDEDKVLACLLSAEAKSDFVKTSTGFSKGGATIHDVALMKFVVQNELKVKASGGIKNMNDALLLLANGASRLGTSSGVTILENSVSSVEY